MRTRNSLLLVQQSKMDAFVSEQKDKATKEAAKMAVNHVMKGTIG